MIVGLEGGSLLGKHYQIRKAIGSGGMGAVYLAEDLRYDHFPTAIKVLYPGVVKTEDARERFKNEIIISYKITHRNVVRAYEYFDEDDLQAYAMEFVEGQDLLDRMSEGKIPVENCMKILKQVAGGLHAIHREGILHRDLKPENIMLTPSGIVKIADFGVARLKEASLSLTQTGSLVGTPKYFSPEYIEHGICDVRSDLYALGIIGYEIISGFSPFRSTTQVSLMVERLKRRIPPVSTISPDCPPELVAVILKAMALKPDDRYQKAHEMREDLDLLLKGQELKHASVADLQKYQKLLEEFGEEITGVTRTSSQLSVQISQPPDLSLSAREPDSSSPNNAVLVQGLSAINWTKFFIGVSVLAIFLVAVLYFFRGSISSVASNFRARSLLELESGVYRGVVTGLDGTASSKELRVWRSSKAVEIWMLSESCRKQKIGKNGSYTCGDIQYQFTVRYLDPTSAIGDLYVLGSEKPIPWSLAKE